MKNILLIVFLFTIAMSQAFADSESSYLNKITMQLKSEQWLTTKTAQVTVAVNAALNDQGVDKIQNDVMQKLSQVAKAEWHVVSFNRQQDKTGLEGITIRAQARVAQSDLAGIRNGAKLVSKAGEAFSIENVEFTPTDDETRAANAALMADIYQQAKHEMDVLNTIYPQQHYYLHSVNFINTPTIMPMAANVMMKSAGSAAMSVGDKAQLQATVMIASTPDLPSNLPRVPR